MTPSRCAPSRRVVSKTWKSAATSTDMGSPELLVGGFRPEHEKDPPGTGGRRAVGVLAARYVIMIVPVRDIALSRPRVPRAGVRRGGKTRGHPRRSARCCAPSLAARREGDPCPRHG